MKNLYLLSVHESAPCVLDMLRNLRACDPASEIAIYNSGPRELLHFDLSEFKARAFPKPEPQEWGRGSKAALAMFQWVCREFDFDVATCVDSDMLATREGYPEALARIDWGGTLGALSRSPQRMNGTSPLAPVRAVWSEYDLWRPFLKKRTIGIDHQQDFCHWSFGPGTVYSWPALAEMCRAFSTEPTLQRVLNESRVLGLEEVIFITVIACLGYAIGQNPCSADYLKWRHEFSLMDVEAALVRPDVFFIHPIAREYDNPLRTRIREALCG